MSSLRRICSGCKQELSKSAYYRHQNSSASCPSQQHSKASSKLTAAVHGDLAEAVSVVHSSTSTSLASCEIPSSDSRSFIEGEGSDDDCLGESGDANEEDETEVLMDHPRDCESNDCDEPQQNTGDERQNTVLKAISFFLLFFQLKFRVPMKQCCN